MFLCFRARKYAENCLTWVQKGNAASVSLQKMADVEVALTELTDSYQSLLTSHKKLRSRIGMRDKRAREIEAESANGAVPGDEASRLAYKEQLRARLRSSGQLR
jgi:hypothetical protein